MRAQARCDRTLPVSQAADRTHGMWRRTILDANHEDGLDRWAAELGDGEREGAGSVLAHEPAVR